MQERQSGHRAGERCSTFGGLMAVAFVIALIGVPMLILVTR